MCMQCVGGAQRKLVFSRPSGDDKAREREHMPTSRKALVSLIGPGEQTFSRHATVNYILKKISNTDFSKKKNKNNASSSFIYTFLAAALYTDFIYSRRKPRTAAAINYREYQVYIYIRVCAISHTDGTVQ